MYVDWVGFRHVTYPTAVEGRDPKPPPFKMETQWGGGERGVLTTPYGVLADDLTDQFALHSQWKTASQLSYVLHNPPFPVSLLSSCFSAVGYLGRRNQGFPSVLTSRHPLTDR